jgi:hypothetical protein
VFRAVRAVFFHRPVDVASEARALAVELAREPQVANNFFVENVARNLQRKAAEYPVDMASPSPW